MSDRDVQREMARKTRRSFLVGGAAAVAGFVAWEWIGSRRYEDEEAWPLRLGLRFDEELSRDLFNETRLEQTYPREAVQPGRINGTVGIETEADPNFRVAVEGFSGANKLSISMDEIKSLPKTEVITQLKCVEGWSRVQQWAGVRFRDFAAKYATDDLDSAAYIGMETPDAQYYVGLDVPSAMHPQTLLCYEMNGQLLTRDHGAPLRLAIPVKYGYKNLKRIGKIAYRTTRPPDYWAENGYDWYAGF
jgi:DMSO/TMAO reductase YedYZ molybdopterin-dependent catalytic subunit